MAKKSGVCINIGKPCTKAINREIQTVEATNFVCEECGKELKEKKTPPPPPPIKIFIIVAAVLVLGGAAAALFMGGDTKVETISLNKTVSECYEGDADTLVATVNPNDAKYTLVWASSNPEVATVNSGLVNLVSSGEAVITVSVKEQPDMKAQCQITVSEKEILPEGTDIALMRFVEPGISMNVGEGKNVTLSIEPENADETLTWTSSDEAVATVVDNVVTGVASGKATVTVESNRTHTKATLEVTVEKKEGNLATRSVLGGAATYSSATGIITFLRSTTINLHSRDNEVLHVNRGDKIIGAKVQNGYLIQGEYVDSHGNSQLLTGLNNKLW